MFSQVQRGILSSDNEKHFKSIIFFQNYFIYYVFIILDKIMHDIYKIIKAIEENSLHFFLNL